MGADGGTIPTRCELVKVKKKPEKKNKDEDRAAKWKHCAISQQPLLPPIVACQLGKLYNKESVLEYLLDKAKFDTGAAFEHIRGLKDVKEMQLTVNSAYKSAEDKGDGYNDRMAAQYICPITGLEMSGRYKFCYLYKCGCVLSERALKEVKSEVCTQCNKAYSDDDVVILNASGEELDQMRTRMEKRSAKAKLDKKAKKRQTADAAMGPPEVPTSRKVSKLDSEQPSSSKLTDGSADHKPKLTNGNTASKHKLTTGEASSSKLANGKQEDKKPKSIQEDPNASKALKSIFTSCDKARNQPKGHWVTYNPCFY